MVNYVTDSLRKSKQSYKLYVIVLRKCKITEIR